VGLLALTRVGSTPPATGNVIPPQAGTENTVSASPATNKIEPAAAPAPAAQSAPPPATARQPATTTRQPQTAPMRAVRYCLGPGRGTPECTQMRRVRRR